MEPETIGQKTSRQQVVPVVMMSTDEVGDGDGHRLERVVRIEWPVVEEEADARMRLVGAGRHLLGQRPEVLVGGQFHAQDLAPEAHLHHPAGSVFSLPLFFVIKDLSSKRYRIQWSNLAYN